VNADIRVSNGAFDLQLGHRRCDQADYRLDSVHLCGSGADERERNDMLSWIAALQVRNPIVSMGRHHLVLMGSEPMVVLRMIVIVVGMRVQR
jgi:hypothetical protein